MILEQVKGKLTDKQEAIVALVDLENKVSNEDEGEGQTNLPDLSQSLLGISQKAQKIKSNGLKWKVNSTVLYIWLRANKNPDWRAAPLFEIRNKGSVVITPVLERIVLEDIASGHLPKGIKTYKALSKAFRKQTVSIRLDNRYLDLSRRFTNKTTISSS